MKFPMASVRYSILALMVAFVVQRSDTLYAQDLTHCGFGKRDITPTLPMRLSGYSDRTEPAKDAIEKLNVRSMVMKSATGQLFAIVSVDLLGLAATHNAELAKRVAATHKIPRERLVISCTHTHTGPQLTTPAANLLAMPFTETEKQRALDYAAHVLDQIVAVIGDGISDLQPGKMFLGEGRATFAINRRTLVDGKWLMIHNPNGLVDHSLPVLKIEDANGKNRGVIFNYACHATTLGPNDNQYNPDWPGYAAKFLEESNTGSTALCLIGCGADANPEPRAGNQVKDAVAVSIAHGRAAADGVNKVLAGPMNPIISAPLCSYGYAPLAFDLPSADELKARLEDKNVTIRQHAMNMLEILSRKRMLPSTYPLPLQSWQFGKDLSMVFMGGEVVVDYVLRMKKELTPGYVWVTAYTNDNPGYVASERVRSEGGYEVDYSMYFYNQPGRWSTGTEELIINRIKELRDNPRAEQVREPDEALMMFRLPKGFRVEAVATEPLVMDPVNFTFGVDGKLWVVEMADYPLGDDGRPLGRVVWLEDSDRDGKFDKRTVFLEGLSYPTGVFPWQDGVIVSAAPEILFARDTNGDGRADESKPLYSGFGEFNPQHRMNGFAYGLDHRLYLAGGDPTRVVRSELLDRDVELRGGDFRIEPNTGEIESASGRSQFGRSRDDWGHWFGNDNNHPWFHYVMPEKALQRNPHVRYPRVVVDAFHSDETPPVFPSSRLAARYNELHTANRFTSACSPIIFRDDALGPDVAMTGFVCDPVHNLVQQIRLAPDGITFDASRISDEDNGEFLASTDNWFRPVRLATGPDGALWVADMYRQVIEHPEWIPEHWQSQLDLQAGADRGRIYRIYREGNRPGPLPQLSTMSSSAVADLLSSSNGTLRDMAQQLLIERKAVDVASRLIALFRSKSKPETRVQILWTLSELGKLTPEQLEVALGDEHPQVVIQAIRLCAVRFPLSAPLMTKLCSLSDHYELEVRFELAIALGDTADPSAGLALSRILLRNPDETWIKAAVLSSAVPHANAILTSLMNHNLPTETKQTLLEPFLATIIASNRNGVDLILEMIAKQNPSEKERWPLTALSETVQELARQKSNLAEYAKRGTAESQVISKVMPWFAKAREIAVDLASAEADRVLAIRILGRGIDHRMEDLAMLASLVSPRQPRDVQFASLDSLEKMNTPDVSRLLLSNWKQQSPAVQSQIVLVMLSRMIWTQDLLNAIEDNQITGRDLNATERQRLLTHSDAGIAMRAAKALSNQLTENRQKVLADYSSVLELNGDNARGSEIFKKSCAACHKYRGQGNQLGANLATLQDRSTKALLTAILDPNLAVEGKFRSYTAILKDGRILSGMIIEESSSNITLVASNGISQTLLRNDIDEFKSSGLSFMPEGLEKDLKPQDVADLIAFLQLNPGFTK